jgi:hypothetical protein
LAARAWQAEVERNGGACGPRPDASQSAA